MKPKWRKYKGGWRRGVLEVRWRAFAACWCVYATDFFLGYFPAPEAAMKAADKWWERARKRMEGK